LNRFRFENFWKKNIRDFLRNKVAVIGALRAAVSKSPDLKAFQPLLDFSQTNAGKKTLMGQG
jgi:hypothetical protein